MYFNEPQQPDCHLNVNVKEKKQIRNISIMLLVEARYLL